MLFNSYVSYCLTKDYELANFRQNQGLFVPVHRLGEWWELGTLAVYLTSDVSQYVTDKQFIIDSSGMDGGIGPTGYAPRHELDA
jgi:hypothetical protein